ncbi:MAG TPA: Hpt domain-containing protein, partial [Longimicrobium sp.]|nr:Hpt domain-containing protein [Longimicrobium sp.]
MRVLESGAAPDDDARAELLRALHTLKGNAAMLGLRPMQELVHGVEDAFKGAVSPASLPLDALLRSATALRGALEAAGSPRQDEAFAPLPALRAELSAALAAEPPPASIAPVSHESASTETVSTDVASNDVVSHDRESDSISEPEDGTADSEDGRSESGSSPLAAAPASPARSEVWSGAREETLRIPFARLDPLLSQVDDLARTVEALRAWSAEHAETLQATG